MSSDWRERLRDHGFRITQQRELVYAAVVDLGHSTPDELLAAVTRHDPGINLSTIYRTLDVLEQVGLVRHSHLGHGSPTYHSQDHPLHLHLVCHSCGSVAEVPSSVASGLVGTLVDDHGFVPDMEHFAVPGLCAPCATVDRGRDRARSGQSGDMSGDMSGDGVGQ
jgi:Fur family ferric uptake transcriptional regulator